MKSIKIIFSLNFLLIQIFFQKELDNNNLLTLSINYIDNLEEDSNLL